RMLDGRRVRGKDYGIAVRQNLWPPMGQFAIRVVGRRELLRSSPASSNHPQPAVVGTRVDDLVIRAPATPAPVSFRQIDGGSASDGDLLQTTPAGESNPLSIGRKEWPVRTFCTPNGNGFPLIQLSRVEPGNLILSSGENQLRSILRESEQRPA